MEPGSSARSASAVLITPESSLSVIQIWVRVVTIKCLLSYLEALFHCSALRFFFYFIDVLWSKKLGFVMLIIICWSFLDCLILFLYNIPCVLKHVFLWCMCWPVDGKCSFLIPNSSLFPILTAYLYLVQEADTDENQGTLTFEEFCVFYKMMSLRRDLYLLLLSYSDKKEHLTVEELAQFLKVEQKVPLGCGTGCARVCLRVGVCWLADVRIRYMRDTLLNSTEK